MRKGEQRNGRAIMVHGNQFTRVREGIQLDRTRVWGGRENSPNVFDQQGLRGLTRAGQVSIIVRETRNVESEGDHLGGGDLSVDPLDRVTSDG